jgi:hypothetical protein
MTKDDPQTIVEASLEMFDEGIRAPAVGTFKVAVGHHRDRRTIGSGDMVIILDGKRRCGIDRWLVHGRSLLAASPDLSGHCVV